MKNVKKLFAALLVTAMALSTLTACGSKTETPSADASTDSDNSAATTTVDYPTKDITVVVPYGAGGTTDLCVRGVLDAVDKSVVTKNFIVSNVTGGSGLVGASQFVNAKSDGYTIGVLNCDLVLNNVLGNTDITSDQFVPLACIENDPYLFVVSKDAPYQTFEEFVDYAKAHPGEVTVADTGAAVGQMDGGNIVPLAVTSNERLSTYPDVPAMGELYTELADMQVNSWIMVAVKADTDPEIISFLQDAFAPAAVSDAYKATQEGFFFQPVEEMSNEDMLNFVAAQHSYYESLLK